MSWFGTAKYPMFEEKIEKATSESIPNGDIDFATALEISDLIRSKQVPSKDAMRALKRRFFEAGNLNLQKSAFKLIDFCIKNGGKHFITEIASKEFMDPLVTMLKNDDTNEALKNYMLENIQTWSIMVSTNPNFDYINKTYTRLQNDGFQFPMINDFVDPNMIESKVAPEWQDSDACMMCSKMFTFLNRKHHCRSCGGVFCSLHSSKTIELPELGITIPVRVCDNCYADQKAKRKKNKHAKKHSDVGRIAADEHLSLDDENDEIKRAIELSLKENATKHVYSTPQNSNNTDTLPTVDDDDDEAMKAAIQASLQDLKLKENGASEIKEPTPVQETTTGLYSNLMTESANDSTVYSGSAMENYQIKAPQQRRYIEQELEQQQKQSQPLPSSVSSYQSLDTNNFNGNDEMNVISFIDKLHKLGQNSFKTSFVDPELIKLHSDMILLHPKVVSALLKEQAEIDKYQTLYSKLFAISRLYDETLQMRLKQEQERIQMQHTQLAMNHTSQPYNYSPYGSSVGHQYVTPQLTNQQPPPQTFMSPQSTYGQPPQVFQLQQVDSPFFQQTPQQYTGLQPQPQLQPQQPQQPQLQQQHQLQSQLQPQPQSQLQFEPQMKKEPHTIDTPIETNTAAIPVAAQETPVAQNIFSSLQSLQYAPVPDMPLPTTDTGTIQQPPTKNIEPVAAPKKEPEIVNLIDL